MMHHKCATCPEFITSCKGAKEKYKGNLLVDYYKLPCEKRVFEVPMLNKLLCRLKLHKWKYYHNYMFNAIYRKCTRKGCKAKQKRWLDAGWKTKEWEIKKFGHVVGFHW